MLIYSRAIPENDQEPLQWPEGVVVRGSTVPFFLYFCLTHFTFTITAGRSAPQSAFP